MNKNVEGRASLAKNVSDSTFRDLGHISYYQSGESTLRTPNSDEQNGDNES